MTSKRLAVILRELTPTEFSDNVLLMWISNCENTILTDVMLVSEEDCVELTELSDAPLTVPHPWDKLYLPYMQAQVAHANGEYDHYANYIALYNAYLEEYTRHIIETVNPSGGRAVRDAYYLSAYAIAVEHGFVGTVEEWLASLIGKQGEKGDPGEKGEPGGVTSVAGKTGDVTLDAEDIAAQIDGTAAKTVADALAYLLNKMQNGSITPAEGVYVVVENEAEAALMRKLAEKAEELRQGYETGVGNVAVPIINTEDSAEYMHAAHIIRSDAEKKAAAGDVEVPSVGRVGEMIAENTPTVDEAAIQEAVKAAAVTDFRITRGGGHYTATWKDAGAQKSANIVGGVGLAQVTEILSYVSDTGLPKLHKSKLVGAPMYSVMIGDLIVYTGADYIGSVWSADAGANVEQTVASKNEVFRVVTVTTDGDGNECYLVQRTGLVLPDIGVTDRREEWLAWLVAQNPYQTSDADVSRDEVFRFLSSLPDGLHYLDNPSCWGKFWAVNQRGRCVVFAPPDIYIVNTPTNILKLTGSGMLEKYNDPDSSAAKSVDLLNSVPPKTTADDALKIWAVGADGTPAWTAVKEEMTAACVVNMTKNADGNYTADKTFAELKAVHDAGRTVICSFRDRTQQWDGPCRLPLLYLSATGMGFAAVVEPEQDYMAYVWAYINSSDAMGYAATEIAAKDTVSAMIAAAIGDTATALSDMDSVIGGADA